MYLIHPSWLWLQSCNSYISRSVIIQPSILYFHFFHTNYSNCTNLERTKSFLGFLLKEGDVQASNTSLKWIQRWQTMIGMDKDSHNYFIEFFHILVFVHSNLIRSYQLHQYFKGKIILHYIHMTKDLIQ